MVTGGLIGVMGGFMYAYQNSAGRIMGFFPNDGEVARYNKKWYFFPFILGENPFFMSHWIIRFSFSVLYCCCRCYCENFWGILCINLVNKLVDFCFVLLTSIFPEINLGQKCYVFKYITPFEYNCMNSMMRSSH